MMTGCRPSADYQDNTFVFLIPDIQKHVLTSIPFLRHCNFVLVTNRLYMESFCRLFKSGHRNGSAPYNSHHTSVVKLNKGYKVQCSYKNKSIG
jgi:hypothetical protein